MFQFPSDRSSKNSRNDVPSCSLKSRYSDDQGPMYPLTPGQKNLSVPVLGPVSFPVSVFSLSSRKYLEVACRRIRAASCPCSMCWADPESPDLSLKSGKKEHTERHATNRTRKTQPLPNPRMARHPWIQSLAFSNLVVSKCDRPPQAITRTIQETHCPASQSMGNGSSFLKKIKEHILFHFFSKSSKAFFCMRTFSCDI